MRALTQGAPTSQIPDALCRGARAREPGQMHLFINTYFSFILMGGFVHKISKGEGDHYFEGLHKG